MRCEGLRHFLGTALAHFDFGQRLGHMRLARVLLGVCAAALASGCATETIKVHKAAKPKSKEYFSEAEYGVKASPRAVAAALHLPGVRATRMPRGGGREQVGKPYQVRGKWYYPKEDFGYDRQGTASWYGDAFHGRRTANGEIYDMNQLSAAHPTMPLPSYARVTNLKNGNTIIVRVNDRGPYAHSRLIDMSKRAAQLLDYTGSGTAQVRVQYVGRAPVNGNDDSYLMASFKPGDGGGEKLDAMPVQPDVMVAMAGSTPTSASQPIFEGEQPVLGAAAAQDPFGMMDAALVSIPDIGPIVPDKPLFDPMNGTPVAAGERSLTSAALVSAYAGQRIEAAYAITAPFKAMGLSEARIKQSWKRAPSPDLRGEYVLLGSFSRPEARRLAKAFENLARVTEEAEGGRVSLSLFDDGHMAMDALLEKSWDLGAADAFVVRD